MLAHRGELPLRDTAAGARVPMNTRDQQDMKREATAKCEISDGSARFEISGDNDEK